MEKGEKALRNEQYSEALTAYEQILKIDDKNKQATDGKNAAEKGLVQQKINTLLGSADDAMARNDLEKAQDLIKKVLYMDPQNDRALGKMEEIRQAVLTAKARSQAATFIRKGQEALEREMYPKAHQYFTVALSMDPQNQNAVKGLEKNRDSSRKKKGF